MWFYTAMFVLPPVLVAIWIWWLRLRGKVQVRWWAWPVLLASLPLSLPSHMLLAIGGVIAWLATTSLLEEGSHLAPWIAHVLGYCIWLQLFTWVLGLVVVLRWKGMVFARPKAKRFFLDSVGAVMVPLCLFNAALLWLWVFHGGSEFDSTEVAVAASPDGRLLALVYRYPSRDSLDYEMMCERNCRYPLFARKIGTLTEFVWENKQLVWSRDSQVVALWAGDVPAIAYDFSRRVTLEHPGHVSDFTHASTA